MMPLLAKAAGFLAIKSQEASMIKPEFGSKGCSALKTLLEAVVDGQFVSNQWGANAPLLLRQLRLPQCGPGCLTDNPCNTCAVAAWMLMDFCNTKGIEPEFVRATLPHLWWGDFGYLSGLRETSAPLMSHPFRPFDLLIQEDADARTVKTAVGAKLAQMSLTPPLLHCHRQGCETHVSQGPYSMQVSSAVTIRNANLPRQ